MADCEYQIGGKGKFYSESEFKKLLSEGYLDKVMMENSLTIRGIKPNEAIASSFQLPSAIQPTVPVTEVKTEEVVTPTGDKNNYKIAQDVTAEVSKENPDASVLLAPKGEDLSLTAVYVGKENRGNGIGTKVLESVKKQADKLGKKIVLDATTELDEETDLGRLESFYQNNGFTKVGENKFEYNPTEQAATTETVTKTEEKVTEPTAEVETLRAEEQKELAEAIPNIESYKVDGEIDKSLMTPEESKSYDEIYNKYDKLITPLLKEPATETAPKTKQPTKEAVAAKNMADILRKAKIKMEGGTAMASFLPGFEAVWNGSIETVSKAIELGGITAGNFRQSIEAGMKALRNTDAYKAITDSKERAKISSQYRKILKSAYAEGYDVDADNLRAAEFDTFNEELEASKEKEKFAGGLSAKELSDLKAKAKKFVNDNLPVDNYRKTEVKSYVAKNFDKAKNVADIQKNLEAVNALLEGKEAKMAEKSKEQLIKDINSKVKANSKKVVSTNRRTGRKTGKISLPAQRKISELHKQGAFDNLEAMTQEELKVLNENIDNILTTGRADKKFDEITEDNSKRAVNGIVLEELGGKPVILNKEKEILAKFDEKNGVVVINGYSMNKSRFETFISNNPDADLSNVEFYIDEQSNVENLKSKTQGPLKRSKQSTLFAIRDLETAVKLLGRGAPKTKAYLEDKIMKPIREAENKKQDYIFRAIKEYNSKKDEIFGTVGGVSKSRYTLNNSSGISAGETSLKGREEDTLTNAQVIHYYGLINNKDPEKRQANIDTLKKYNGINPKEITDYMNDPKNKKLMDYYNYVNERFNGDLADQFIPRIESLYGIEIEKGNYWPEPKSGTGTDPGSILDLEGGNSSSISAIAPQMKHRNNAQNYPFEAVSADEMFHRYIESMAHADQFIPIVQNVYSLLSKNNIPHIINKFNDVNRYNTFITDLGIVLTDKSPFENDFVSGMANANAITTLLLRLKSVSQQAISGLNYYTAGIKDGVYPQDLLKSLLPVNETEMQFVKDFLSDNSYLQTRISGGMSTQDTQALKVGIDRFLESKLFKNATTDFNSNINQAIKDLTKVATNASMSFIKLGDFIAIASPGAGGSFALAQFKNNLANGQDVETAKENAMQRWFEETERTQQPAIAREIISNASYKSTYRVFFPYLSANNAMVKKVSKGLIDIRDWKNLNKNERAQAVSDVIYYTLFAGVPFALISSGGVIAWLKYNDDDDDEAQIKKNRILYDAFADGLQSNISTLGLSGWISKMAINQARGKKFYNNIPVLVRALDISNVLFGLYNVEGDISKLDQTELNDFWKGWEPTEFEMRKMKRMTPSERNQYLKDNPFAVKKFYKEVGEEYKKLNYFEKMGGNSKKSLERILGKDNFDELIESVGSYVEGDADANEVLLQIKSRDKDFYFKEKEEDKLYDDILSESLGKIKKEPKKSRGGSSSKPGSFPKQKFGPNISKFKIN